MFIKKVLESSNVYQINMVEFLEKQNRIAMKYMSKLEGNSEIEVMDKYILHIIEELWEVQDTKIKQEAHEEACDVAMYLGSLYSILANRRGIDFRDIKDVNFTLEDITLDAYKVVKDLISIRRFYPGRKWHKAEKVELIDKCIDQISMDIIQNCIITIFKALLSHENEVEGFNFQDYLITKQNYILNLEEVNTDRQLHPMSIYRHFKNKLYIVIGESKSTPLNKIPVNEGTELFLAHFTEDDDVELNIHVYRDVEGNLYHSSKDYNDSLVLYKALYNDAKYSYARPLDMFLSKVDKNKYPNVNQEFRFELVK